MGEGEFDAVCAPIDAVQAKEIANQFSSDWGIGIVGEQSWIRG